MAISELIASTIGLAEGVVDLDGVYRDLVDAGTRLRVRRGFQSTGAGRAGRPEGRDRLPCRRWGLGPD